MNAGALLARGIPPFGLGTYLRDAPDDAARWTFRCVLGNQRDYRQVAAASKARGPIWLYAMPDAFYPDRWRASVDLLAARASEVGAEGVIVDFENRWPQLARAERERELRAAGERLAQLSLDMRVGFTSYPSFPSLDVLASAAGDGVWGSPQIYSKSSHTAEAFAAWFNRWRDLFGARVIPSIAGWESDPAISSPKSYRDYLSRLPLAPGAIVWRTGRIPGYMASALDSYSPGGNDVGTLARAFVATLIRPASAAIAGVFALVFFLAFFAARYV